MQKSSENFLVIGHRGARGHAPENTLLAIERGIALGAHAVEFDVQLHPSGALLLLHDLTLQRTTNGRGALRGCSYETLRALDAGEGEKIPTLDEALELIAQRVIVNVELKTSEGTAAAVAAVLRRFIGKGWPAQRFLVSSFDLPELRQFKRIAPEIPVGALLGGVPLDLAACATELEAVSLNISAEFLDAQLIADAKARGLKIYVYTVNESTEIAALRVLGIDGVFTDFPDRAVAI
jgi:glycerophosphoryl diester phosphodiesterase